MKKKAIKNGRLTLAKETIHNLSAMIKGGVATFECLSGNINCDSDQKICRESKIPEECKSNKITC
jgi:hypothetical protein